jgi:hypothetical protein
VSLLALVACDRVRQDESQGTATLTWGAITVDTTGKPLTDLAGYRIYYGTSASSLTQKIELPDPHATGYVVTNLAPGTWYFAVTAYTRGGSESDRSNIGQKKIN